jgi:hypothetical protein
VKFICDPHREIYASDPRAALIFWSRTLSLARQKVVQAQWGEASVIYGNAFEVAEILLTGDDCDQRAIARYLQTSAEFAYALRKNTCINEVGQLISMVRHRLHHHIPSHQLNEMLQPLLDMTIRPETEVGEEIELALVMEVGRYQTLH